MEYNKTVIVDYNTDNFPVMHTNKIIVAVYRGMDTDTMVGYINSSMFEYFPFCHWRPDHHIYERVRSYVGHVCTMANNSNIKADYIVIDTDIEVLKFLHSIKMNYILVVPNSYEKALNVAGFLNAKDAASSMAVPELICADNYIASNAYLTTLAFRMIYSDIPFYEILAPEDLNNTNIIYDSYVRMMDHINHPKINARENGGVIAGCQYSTMEHDGHLVIGGSALFGNGNFDKEFDGGPLVYSSPSNGPSFSELLKIGKTLYGEV